MKAFVFDVEFLWGFQARVAGLSKSPPSYLFPPPTTVIGALSESLARRLGIGERDGVGIMRELSQDLIAISFKPLNAFPSSYMTLSRVLAIGNRKDTNYPTPKDVYLYKSFDAPARGSTFLGTIDGQPPIIRYFIIFKDSSRVTHDDIWRIKRIGSRESLVSVARAWNADVKLEGTEGVVATAVPEVEGIEIASRGGTIREYYVYPYRFSDAPAKIYLTDPSLVRPFIIPIPYVLQEFSFLEVKVHSPSFSIFSLRFEGQEDKVVGLAD